MSTYQEDFCQGQPGVGHVALADVDLQVAVDLGQQVRQGGGQDHAGAEAVQRREEVAGPAAQERENDINHIPTQTMTKSTCSL